MEELATILIVDDEPAGRAVLSALLADQGYYVSEAASGAEALAKASAIAPDIVLLDVMMPGMDGYEVCRRLRSNPDLGRVPILMVTALEDRDSKLRGIEAGADDFVSKPFDRVELRTRVRTIVRLDRFRQLHSERAKFEWAVENSDDGYLVLGPNDDILYANPKARRYLGMTRLDGHPVSGKFMTLARLHYQVSAGRTESRRDESGANVQHSMGYLVKPESASHQAVWIRVDRLKMGAASSGEALVRLSDATAQMALLRDCWTFNALVRHKLATPVGNTLGALDLLAEGGGPDILALATRSARKLKDEVERVFDYMKSVGSGEGGEPVCTVIEAGEIAKSVAASLALGAPEISFAVTRQVATARLTLSRRCIEIVLLALLENSKKFHPANSPSLRVTIAGDAGVARILVADDGQTLSAEQLGKAWLPYYQGEKYFTGQVPGMGLGLATVATIMGRVGGTCRIYNKGDGPGVVVELSIPVAKSSDESKPAALSS